MSYSSNERDIKKLLLVLNTSKIYKKEVTRTIIESYSNNLYKLTKRYKVTIWSKKKIEDKEYINNHPGSKKKKVVNIPEVYSFSRQIDVLIFLSQLASEVLTT